MIYDFCILGAGLAGLTLAKELSEISGAKILIVDPNGIAGGASGSPIGLVNPATGRFATKSWKAEEAVNAIKENLREIAEHYSEKFYSADGVIRPAMDAKIARRMKENIDSTDWPKGWCEWLEEVEIKERFPNLTCKDGGVWVSEGVTVAIPIYLKALAQKLKKDGVDIVTNKKYHLVKRTSSIEAGSNPKKLNWTICFENEYEYNVEHLVGTAGIKTKEFDFWKDLPLHPIKGQVAVFECNENFPYKSAVSALGYFASLDQKTFVAGSTYEHKFDHEQTDEKGLSYIQDRLFRVMPELKENIKLIDQWSGVRASTPDRMPVIGPHQLLKNCSVFAGLGSKGLLYSSLLAKELANHLVNNDKLSEEISIARFKN